MHRTSLDLAFRNLPLRTGLLLNCCNYVLTRLYRIIDWGKEEHADNTDLIAYSCRCIFEAGLMLRHYGSAEDAVVRMKVEMLHDDYEILKGSTNFLGSPTEATKEIFIELESRTASKNDKTPPYRELAQRHGWLSEYDAFYKLYSKYAHPSAYYLVADHRIVHHGMVREIFLDRAVVYSEYFLKEFEDCLKANAEKEEPK